MDELTDEVVIVDPNLIYDPNFKQGKGGMITRLYDGQTSAQVLSARPGRYHRKPAEGPVMKAIFLWLALFTVCRMSIAQDTVFLPLHTLIVNSGFGWRCHPVNGRRQFHQGIDLEAHYDTVFSVLPGVVIRIGNDRVTGNYVVIDHGNGLETLYGHLSAIAVSPGDPLNAGDVIAISGASGYVTGPHLHFAVRLDGRGVDPLAFLRGLFRPP